jgi:hypothetical protein
MPLSVYPPKDALALASGYEHTFETDQDTSATLVPTSAATSILDTTNASHDSCVLLTCPLLNYISRPATPERPSGCTLIRACSEELVETLVSFSDVRKEPGFSSPDLETAFFHTKAKKKTKKTRSSYDKFASLIRPLGSTTYVLPTALMHHKYGKKWKEKKPTKKDSGPGPDAKAVNAPGRAKSNPFEKYPIVLSPTSLDASLDPVLHDSQGHSSEPFNISVTALQPRKIIKIPMQNFLDAGKEERDTSPAWFVPGRNYKGKTFRCVKVDVDDTEE